MWWFTDMQATFHLQAQSRTEDNPSTCGHLTCMWEKPATVKPDWWAVGNCADMHALFVSYWMVVKPVFLYTLCANNTCMHLLPNLTTYNLAHKNWLLWNFISEPTIWKILIFPFPDSSFVICLSKTCCAHNFYTLI